MNVTVKYPKLLLKSQHETHLKNILNSHRIKIDIYFRKFLWPTYWKTFSFFWKCCPASKNTSALLSTKNMCDVRSEWKRQVVKWAIITLNDTKIFLCTEIATKFCERFWEFHVKWNLHNVPNIQRNELLKCWLTIKTKWCTTLLGDAYKSETLRFLLIVRSQNIQHFAIKNCIPTVNDVHGKHFGHHFKKEATKKKFHSCECPLCSIINNNWKRWSKYLSNDSAQPHV